MFETQREAGLGLFYNNTLSCSLDWIGTLSKSVSKFRKCVEASEKQVVTETEGEKVSAGFFSYCVKVTKVLKSFPERIECLGNWGRRTVVLPCHLRNKIMRDSSLSVK